MIEFCSYKLDVPHISVKHLIKKYPSLQGNCIKTPVRRHQENDRHIRLQLEYEYTYDYTKSKNQYDITEIIVKEYFNVDNYQLLRDRLCPRINNRMAYILILESLLIEPDRILNPQQDEKECIIDIGTGSSLIYPIIANKLSYKNSLIIGTEINEVSLNNASTILNNNFHLKQNISLIRGSKDKLIPSVDSDIKVKYLICNPPFYSSKEELLSKESSKSINKPNELIINEDELLYEDNGELGFVKKLIDESIDLSTQYKFKRCWFTSQVGIHKHVEELNSYLDQKGIPYKFNETIKFNTSRWIVGWRFEPFIFRIQKYISPLILCDNKIIKKLDHLLLNLDEYFSKLRKKSHDRFEYRISRVYHNKNICYIRTNEYVWLRRIRRLIERGGEELEKQNLFNKDVLIRVYLFNDKVDINVLTTDIADKDVTIHSNSMNSLFKSFDEN
ncbi:uncharacterized protein RJT21DRAFT_27000 [Scheffersomyces amazonensis]|uniref:uncharacterized protein n=1 Tax=Scheffersomyces amazonensis TaxID=1078765 RepID=UPI00315DA3DF